jgi:colanic acid/amylovoran biosynthesis protein
MVKMLITGAYCVLNKGDAALRLGGLSSLKQFIPDAEFTIMTPFPEIDSKIYKDENVVKAIDTPLEAVNVIIRCSLWKIIHDYLGFKYNFVNKLLDTEEIDQFLKSVIVIDISGDSISEVTGFRGTVYHFLHIWLALTLNKPTVVYAQSVGPFKLTKSLAKFLLNKVDLITLRGKNSYDYLQKIGINKPPVYLTADLAFLMAPASEERIDKIFSDYRIEGDTFVGVSVSDWISKYHGYRSEFVKLMANVVDYVVEELNTIVIFIPHVTGPKKEFDDRIIAADIYKIVNNKNKIKLIQDDYTPQEMKGIIGRCNLFIGARMHACIAALSMCVPTINISYHHKSNEIMAMFGLERNVLSAQEINYELLISKINETWTHREEIKEILLSKIDWIKQQAMLNAEIVNKMLNKNLVMSLKY